MCLSNDAFELRAYEVSEEIRKNTIYNFVRVEAASGKEVEFSNGPKSIHLELITKVILKDDVGTVYCVEPNANGLSFAKGEITYQEYNQIQKKEMIQGLSVFSVIIGAFFVMSWGLSSFLL